MESVPPVERTGTTRSEEDPQQQRKRIRTAIIIGVLLLIFTAGPGIAMVLTPHPHGTLYEDPQPAPDFELPRSDGGTLRLSDLQGDVVVLYFGYTSCPDVCPTTLFDLSRAMDELSEDAEDVQVVFVTIDPEVDTPDRIEPYLDYFDERFIGLYGTEDELKAVQDLYNVKVLRSDRGETIPGYGITHTTSMFVINREGILKLRMHHETDVEFLVRDLKYFIRGKL